MNPARALLKPAAAAALMACFGSAQAFTFQTESVRGNFDSTLSMGVGVRANSPSCSLLTDGAVDDKGGAVAGCLAPTSLLGDQGNLNYGRGDLFTGYLKGSHELLLKMPSDFTFLGRVNWVRDFAATSTTGFASAVPPPPAADGLSDDARDDLRFKARLLDFWVSKSFSLGDQQARVRVGNQVISWGESLFLPGGINSTNAMDIMRLSQPGTQLKEVFLPAPMISLASGLGQRPECRGLCADELERQLLPAHRQLLVGGQRARQGPCRLRPGRGRAAQRRPVGRRDCATSRRAPSSTSALYAMNFHDKTPNFSVNINNTGAVGWTYAEDRHLLGVSANFPLGDWAIGTELSYRPKDAVALNAMTTGCSSQNGNCWVDEKRLQFALTGLLSLTPSTGGGILKMLGADTATVLSELVVISYPDLKKDYGGDLITAGGWGWGQETDPLAAPAAKGSKTSAGINFDVSWVYDGTLIPGWQVIPEIYYFQAISGYTPNLSGLFMKGAKSVNLTVSFIRNPATWQFALNYAKFWGGGSALDQPLGDRAFFGAVLSRNF